VPDVTIGATNAYLAVPFGSGGSTGPWPGVVVIHEAFGLNADTRAHADRLAALGYLALAPDLLDGKLWLRCIRSMFRQLRAGSGPAFEVLDACRGWLAARPDCTGKTGVIGFCMGGKYSIRLAAADPGIRAAVMYYGAPITDAATIKQIRAAVLGNFGGEDKGPTPGQVNAFRTALQKAGKRVDFKIYPKAGHAFANVNNPWGGYREEAAKDAWARTLAFFKKELKEAPAPKAPDKK